MRASFDHLIVLVHDLDKAARDFESLGFTVTERHDGVAGSMLNRFISFADGSYLLLSAFADPAAADKHRLGPLLQRGEGWADYSFVVEGIEEITARLQSLHAPTRGPVQVSNSVASGDRWSLDLLMTGIGAGGDDALPFIVEDRAGRAHRIPAATRHRNGAAGIAGIRVATSSVATVIATLRGILGETISLSETEAHGRPATRIGFGTGWIDVLEDLSVNKGSPGLFEAVIATTIPQPEPDPALTHGATIRFAPR
ncbi:MULTISPECIES: VOC family protein [unclassified Chelatococcus]|uniref:VOC family protein n=1 Tax=unclassified Chelatococcus TaxID=2638111 RepID=UPI001BCDA5F0|nr:VOC family protein [Chelatococcus sp.]MBS7743161.1 VOC family protein [Chelatococcus sp. HY11]CAH1651504.1 Glyoxalase-like protein [Hyphomicrobiales bacterium]MBX3541721.1 VOC family protein [Chelatococcus sp.]MCO5074387.1 VOC family protein [Chelatococcus sp.]CAH1693288.1 Glyoxalase-like protein [Hyphomicrobiales bacterium]